MFTLRRNPSTGCFLLEYVFSQPENRLFVLKTADITVRVQFMLKVFSRMQGQI